MKKYSVIIAAILVMAGCQPKSITPEVDPSEGRVLTKTVSAGGEWLDESKTEVNLAGNLIFNGHEELAVGITKSGLGTPYIGQIVKAISDGQMNYTFNHNAVDGAQAYDYFFVMPYRPNTNISTNGAKASMYVKLDAVQHPTATSFDPLQDYMIATPVMEAPEQLTSITKEQLMFKRIMAVTCLTVKDSDGVLKGDPIKSVEFGFPVTDNVDKKNNLISLTYLRQSADYKLAGANGYADVTTNHVSGTVTAEYAEGLNAEGGVYKVWYVTMPVQKAAQTPLTVIVKTAKKKVTRTVNIPNAMNFTAEQFNKLSFNISGEGYVAEDLADANDYFSIYSNGGEFVAGGLTINKTTYPECTNLNLQSRGGDQALIKEELQKGGLIFLDTEDGTLTIPSHYKPKKGTVLVGRYKNHQPKIVMDGDKAIYFDAGDIVLKNLDITFGANANYGMLYSNGATEDTNYFVVEDCNLTVPKCALAIQDNAPDVMVKSISMNNCVAKMTGPDSANYNFMQINKAGAATPTDAGYGKLENISLTNCVIYAEQAMAAEKRRNLCDLGNKGANYTFPTENLNLVVDKCTLYNINANSNVLFRAYVMNSASITKLLTYADVSAVSGYTSTYIFGLYKALEGVHSYKIRNNYGAGCRADGASVDVWKWQYKDKEGGPGDESFNVGGNTLVHDTTADFCFDEVDLSVGYFKPVSTVTAGADYETKYWINK